MTGLVARLIVLTLAAAELTSGSSAKVDFNRDIRPVFSENCYACHGPDKSVRKAGLRLDTKEGAFRELRDGGYAIVAGNRDASVLYQRISSEDEFYRMPPKKIGKPLSAAQVDLIRRWIEQGAEWERHWSFIKPSKPPVPDVKSRDWTRNAIDSFILAALESRDFEPSPEAVKTALIRRLSLDLRGLPPRIDQIDEFLADQSPHAYEKLVDRMLASPHYGERMAQDWLDLARYGDTNGYHHDSDRSMWMYRDYVINAFNDNKPFDRFTIENMAGDLLPNPTIEQLIASGFNRNVTFNEEGGADPDEFSVKYAVDRASTTATVYLGMTFGCAECHEHKYDPISQKEFYQFYAFFNSVEGEKGAQGRDIPLPPLLKVPSEKQADELRLAREKLTAHEKELRDHTEIVKEAPASWVAQIRKTVRQARLKEGLAGHYEFDARDDRKIMDSSGNYRHGLFVGSKPRWSSGHVKGGLDFAGDGNVVQLRGLGEFDRDDAFAISAWIRNHHPSGTFIAKMDDENAHRGFDFGVHENRIWAHLVHHWPDNAIEVRTKRAMPLNTWHHYTLVYDGSSKAGGLSIYIDGERQDVEIENDNLSGILHTDLPLQIGSRSEGYPLYGVVDDIRIYHRFVAPAEVKTISGPAIYAPLLQIPAEHRSDDDKVTLKRYYLETRDAEYSRLTKLVDQATDHVEELDDAVPHTMVMREMAERRPAFLLVRGDFQQKGEEVVPDVPTILPRLPEDKPRNRLGLAYWLVDPDHPLVARVTVNRLWQHLFGTGLVKTSEDFGAQGELPSHPKLLDWLAVDFVQSGWNVKAIIKKMVISATYRQRARVKDRSYEADPDNRLLYRAPRIRLAAEQIRDVALAVGGLLNPRIGGPSVNPYQPDDYYGDKGRWKWEQSNGDDLYRRGLYTFWRRTTFYPTFQIFDAPSREICTARRPRTNTPLQALVTLNDPTFVEAARVFGQRIMTEGGNDLESRILYAFRMVVTRAPTEQEAALLTRLYYDRYEHYAQRSDAAAALVKQGEYSAAPSGLDATEHAAWTAVANILLNLDETITRG